MARGMLKPLLVCVTANLPDEAIEPYTQDMLPTGVHYGYASVHFLDGPQADANECRKQNKTHEDVFPMVMSIGWNPFYKNQRRTAVYFPKYLLEICLQVI